VSDDLKEFIDDNEAAARAKAARHLNVSDDELDAKLVPPELEIANLAGRVIVLASVRRAGSKAAPGRSAGPARPAGPIGPAGPVGEFVRGMLERMGIQKISGVEERNADGEITVTVDSAGLASFSRDHTDLLAALGHLAERAAQKELGSEDVRARVELAGRGGDRGRGGRERGDGRRDRGERGGRRERGRGGRDRDRSRGRRDASGDRDDAGPENPELEARVRDAGQQVLDSGEATTLDEMNSRDRWVVHNVLKELDGLESESVGEGRLKRVKIYPA
jgi:hypothetical protein